MTTGYSYIRFSTPAQIKGDSLRRQLAKAERYANDHRLILDTTMRDTGISAFKGDHRRKGALASFLAAIEAGNIAPGSYMIVENIDRLSRENPWDALGMVRAIIDAEIIVVSLIDDMVYSRALLRSRPELMQTLQAALTKGHRESRDKADRLHEAWTEKREDILRNPRRKLTLQGPRWLDWFPDDPSEKLTGEFRENFRADVMRDLMQWSLDGLGRELIVRRLNDRGIAPFRHGDGWNPSTVLFLLKDRRVIGEYQPHTKMGGKRRPIGDPIPNYFPAIVEPEIFYAVQDAIARRHSGATPGTKGKVPNLFVTLAKCECGRSMEHRDKNNSRQIYSAMNVYLQCSGCRRSKRLCVNDMKFRCANLEALVLDWITDIKVTDEQASRATVAGMKLSGKQAQRDDLARRLKDALDDREKETDEDFRAHFMSRARTLKAELSAVEAEIEKLTEEVRSNKRTVVDDKRDAVRKVRAEMAGATGETLFVIRARLASALRQVIDHIEFQADSEFMVTLRGGVKAYRFNDGGFIAEYDMSYRKAGAVAPNGEPYVSFRFPTVAQKRTGRCWLKSARRDRVYPRRSQQSGSDPCHVCHRDSRSVIPPYV